MSSPSDSITIRQAAADEIVDLRHLVLRGGLARSEAIFAGDELVTSRHVAAVLEGRVVGCVSLHRVPLEGAPAWQLRGMAVHPNLQRAGIGGRMLQLAHQLALDGPPLLWCNAREPAIGFYRNHGWEIISGRYEIPTAGPHFKMRRLLEPPSAINSRP